MTINLSNMSAVELMELSRKAKKLADDLFKEQPSYELAVTNGIIDKSYNTPRWGLVADYRGEAVIEMADGRRWRAVGHPPQGNAHIVSRDGYISFTLMET